eukprot:TRINITY_DN5541_c0_g1_i4.p1 TRINITY_DN5541_c0_g1~~TRINITY_DN5541_c0_g1_i4.p1  ORF type:complete len:905 (-),score=337.74 TRINITY_DN5541_c0_g1_i4:2149-4863(-)
MNSGDPKMDRELQRLFAMSQAGKTANSDFNRGDSPSIMDEEEIRKEEEEYKRMVLRSAAEDVTNNHHQGFRSLQNSMNTHYFDEEEPHSFAVHASSDTDRERLARTHQMLKEYEEMMIEKRREKSKQSENQQSESPPPSPLQTSVRRPSIRQKKADEKAQILELKKRMYAYNDGTTSSLNTSTLEKTPLGRGRSRSMNKPHSQSTSTSQIPSMKYTASEGDLAALEEMAEESIGEEFDRSPVIGNYDSYLSPSSRRYHRGQRQRVTVVGPSLNNSGNQSGKNVASPSNGLLPVPQKAENTPKSLLRTSWNNGFKIFKKDKDKEKEREREKESKSGSSSPRRLSINNRVDSGEMLFNYASSNVEGIKTKLSDIEQMYAEGRQNQFASINDSRTPLKLEEQPVSLHSSNPSSPRSHNSDPSEEDDEAWPKSTEEQKSQNRKSIVDTSGFPAWLNQSISSDDPQPEPKQTFEENRGGGYTSNVSSFIGNSGNGRKETKGGGYTTSSADIGPSPKIVTENSIGAYSESAVPLSGGYTSCAESLITPINKNSQVEDSLNSKFEKMNIKEAKVNFSDVKDKEVDEEADEDVMMDVISLFGQLSREDQCDAGVELSEIFPGAIQRLRASLKERVRRAKAETSLNEDGETWNQQFQQILENLNGCDDTQERISIYSQLSHLAQDFVHCAKTYGKLIISELYLPNDQKTIRPCDIGGFAGGLKYITKGILFKLAVDANELYGSDMIAAKVAGNDLKGLVQYFNLGVSRLHFPLMALVDYMGFRIQAISLLPINTETLIYGTANGGKTVFDKNIKFNAKMRLAGKKLNLCPHAVGLTAKSSKILYSCADVEGHDGKDGRFYLIDFARCFPPIDFSSSSIPNSHLFRLFRPEFVRRYSKPLCPDTYSVFFSFHFL